MSITTNQMSNVVLVPIHQKGDHVYVRDTQYAWLPAIVEDVKEHTVLIRINLPKDWDELTVQHTQTEDDNDSQTNQTLHGEQRWEQLNQYHNHHLPMQCTIRRGCDDLNTIQHVHEAEILYQIKERYCSMDQPYTRIALHTEDNNTGNSIMIVAVNPCRHIPSLYTVEQQQLYLNLAMMYNKSNTLLLPSASNSNGTQHNSPLMNTVDIITHDTFIRFDRKFFSSHRNTTQKSDSTCGDEKKEEENCTLTSNDVASTSAESQTTSSISNPLVTREKPHIYEVSSSAYHDLITTKCNQAILALGESGSGKTESIKIVLKHLMSIPPTLTICGSSQQQQQQQQQQRPSEHRNQHYSDDGLVSLTLASSSIFESFGNAKTIHNTNSSRFGKVTKLQYIIDGPTMSTQSSTSSVAGNCGACLIGASFQACMLEMSRVVSHVEGERNFHIFYQMLSAPSTIKKELLGPDWSEATPQDFRYLNRQICGIKDYMLDASNWTYTLKALIVFGWDGNSLERLIRALGIILLIGNIEFECDDQGKICITKTADLVILSSALGIPAAELELALTQRTIQTAHDLLLIPLTPEQANEACEALSKIVYTRIFETIVKQINFTTTSPATVVEKTKTIALVDVFGFECFAINRFEQFCINYANERLHQKYAVDCLRRRKVEYETEGIIIPEWENVDNFGAIGLFENDSGLIPSLNSLCGHANGTNSVSHLFCCIRLVNGWCITILISMLLLAVVFRSLYQE
jgi:myosin heavy subunit